LDTNRCTRINPAPFDSATIGTGSTVGTAQINTGESFTLDTLTFNSSSAVYEVVNQGSLTLAGAGVFNIGSGFGPDILSSNVLIFKNSASMGSDVTIFNSNGIVNFEDNSVGGLGETAIINNNGGAVNFENNSTAGNGTLSNNIATATVNFQNNSTAASATIFNDGIVNFQDNSSPANAAILFLTFGVVNFENSSPSTVYNGVINSLVGPGTINKIGAGVLTFLNASPSFTGTTNINAGTLAIGDVTHPAASLGNSSSVMNVNSSGTLSGYGSVGGNVVNDGTVYPGSGASVGILSIGGTYTQQSGGTYAVQVTQAGTNDILAITDTATLAGTLAINDIGTGFLAGHTYQLLTASSLGGTTFSGVDLNGLSSHPFVTTTVTYPGNDEVDLVMSLNNAAFASASVTPNQQSVANYLLVTGGTPGTQALLSTLTTNAAFQAAMDQISGATYANQTVAIAHVGNWFERELDNRLLAFPSCSQPCCICPNGMLNYENCNQARGGWISAYGGEDDIHSDQVSGLTTDMGGVAAGYEWPFNCCQGKIGVARLVN